MGAKVKPCSHLSASSARVLVLWPLPLTGIGFTSKPALMGTLSRADGGSVNMADGGDILVDGLDQEFNPELD